MNKRISIGAVIGVICAAVFFIITFVSGVSDLSAKPAGSSQSAQNGEIVEFDVTFAKEVYEIRHKIFGIIPANSEHFYLTLSGDDINPLVVRADEKWFSENFTADGAALSAVTVSGLVKKAGSKDGLDLNSVNDQLDSIGSLVHINSGQYADSLYVSEAIMKIAAGVLIAATSLTVLLIIILLAKGVLVRGGRGVNIMAAAAVIQALAFIVIMVIL